MARIKSGELTINDKDRDFKLTDPSSRFYLADACFTAGFEAQTEEEHALLDQMHAALLSPRWPLFLGRRAFPPAAPVVLEIAEAGLLDALRRAPSPPLDGANRPRTDSGAARYVLDADAEAPDAPRRLAGADVPVSFQSDRRRHRTRETITLTLPIASWTLHVSRLTLNPEHPQARKDLAAPYELHRTLANVFPGPRATEQQKHEDDYELGHGMLYRAEEPAPRGAPVLVQSVTKPDWSRLEPGYLLRLDGMKAFEPSFREGQRLRFRLVANPVRRVRVEGKKNPRRMPLVHPRAKDGIAAGYLDWLERQAGRSGFAVGDVAGAPFRLGSKQRVTNDPEEIQAIERGEREGIAKARIPHFGVRFDGLLTVTDPKALAAAVRDGIGPAKAFGFGLLSLAPAG